MNRTQGHSNRALTMVCGARHQKLTRTQTQQQPQYSGPFETVNTKCGMSATSSRKPHFMQVFRKKSKLTSVGTTLNIREEQIPEYHEQAPQACSFRVRSLNKICRPEPAKGHLLSDTIKQNFPRWQIRTFGSAPRPILPLIRTAVAFRDLTSR